MFEHLPELAKDHVVESAYETQATLMEGALNYAKSFDKKRSIFAEHKKRFHKQIVHTIDVENKPLIETLALMTK